MTITVRMLLIVAALGSAAPTLFAQGLLSQLSGHYEASLERLFAVEEEAGTYIARYSGSDFEPEMQIQFSVPFAHPCAVRVWYLERGAKPILTQLFNLLIRTPTLSQDEAISRFTVLQRTLDVPCDGHLAKLLQDTAKLSVPVPDQHSIGIDGVSYQLRASMGARRLLYETIGSAIGDPSSDPIVNWMSSVGVAIREALRE